jgi:fructose-specific phosphotransferase system IIC component
MLAALAGNGALWYLLQHTESYGFLEHPQLWLIPAALSVLVAAYLNQDRFTEEQMTSIRYISLMTVYVSSTSDIFINGVTRSPWLPLVLAGLSVAGVLCGIVLRVRAFLFLGATFLLIAVITMIWYASVNLGWTWLWYVAGIMMGTMIIFTFALFEKKRNEVLRVVEDLRGWES